MKLTLEWNKSYSTTACFSPTDSTCDRVWISSSTHLSCERVHNWGMFVWCSRTFFFLLIKLEYTSEIICSTSLLQAAASCGLNETPVKGSFLKLFWLMACSSGIPVVTCSDKFSFCWRKEFATSYCCVATWSIRHSFLHGYYNARLEKGEGVGR